MFPGIHDGMMVFVYVRLDLQMYYLATARGRCYIGKVLVTKLMDKLLSSRVGGLVIDSECFIHTECQQEIIDHSVIVFVSLLFIIYDFLRSDTFFC